MIRPRRWGAQRKLSRAEFFTVLRMVEKVLGTSTRTEIELFPQGVCRGKADEIDIEDVDLVADITHYHIKDLKCRSSTDASRTRHDRGSKASRSWQGGVRRARQVECEIVFPLKQKKSQSAEKQSCLTSVDFHYNKSVIMFHSASYLFRAACNVRVEGIAGYGENADGNRIDNEGQGVFICQVPCICCACFVFRHNFFHLLHYGHVVVVK